MKDYKKIIELEMQKAKRKFPKPSSKKDFKSVSDYLKYIEKTLSYANKRLVEVGNNYAEGKKFSKEQIEQMQEINNAAAKKLFKEIKR